MLLFDKRLTKFARFSAAGDIFFFAWCAFWAVAFHDMFQLVMMFFFGLIILWDVKLAKRRLATLPVEDHKE